MHPISQDKLSALTVAWWFDFGVLTDCSKINLIITKDTAYISSVFLSVELFSHRNVLVVFVNYLGRLNDFGISTLNSNSFLVTGCKNVSLPA